MNLGLGAHCQTVIDQYLKAHGLLSSVALETCFCYRMDGLSDVVTTASLVSGLGESAGCLKSFLVVSMYDYDGFLNHASFGRCAEREGRVTTSSRCRYRKMSGVVHQASTRSTTVSTYSQVVTARHPAPPQS